jgi:hypothetical protein
MLYTRRISLQHSHRVGIPVISLCFCKQEDVLHGGAGPIRNALRHSRSLDPRDHRPQPPAILLKSHRHAEGHKHQVLGLVALYASVTLRVLLGPNALQRLLPPVLIVVQTEALTGGPIAIVVRSVAAAGITVTHVEPQCGVVAEHAPHVAEALHEMRDIHAGVRFESEIAEPRATRAGRTELHYLRTVDCCERSRAVGQPLVLSNAAFSPLAEVLKGMLMRVIPAPHQRRCLIIAKAIVNKGD